MGNEMGNSNVSGLQEEENRTVETGEKHLLEDGCADNVKEENHTDPTVDDSKFHEKDAGLVSSEGNQTVLAVEDSNFHEKDAGLVSSEGNQTVLSVEDSNFHEKDTGLVSTEGNQTVLAVEDSNFHEKDTELASGEGNQIVPAVEDSIFREKDRELRSDEGNQIVPPVEETNFLDKITGLASDEGHEIVPEVADTNFHEKTAELASAEGHEIFPADEDTDFHEKLTTLPSDEKNQTVPAIEDKDIHEKVAGLASDDRRDAGDHLIDHQTSAGIEQDDYKVQSPPGSPQIVMEPKHENAESRIQPASFSEDNNNDETLIKSNLEDKLLETSEKQIERQISCEREEEETRSSSCTNSSPNSPEHLLYVEPDFDLHELDKIHVDLLVENQTESMQRSEEILGQNQLNAEIVHSLVEGIGSDSIPEIEKKMEEMVYREEQVSDGDEVSNGLSSTSTRNGSLDLQKEQNDGGGGLVEEMILNPNGSRNLLSEDIPEADPLKSFQEVAEPELKCMVLTEDPKLFSLELENKDDMYDLCPTQLFKESDSFHPHQEKDGKEDMIDNSCSSAMDSRSNSTSDELCSLSEMDTLPADLIVIDCNNHECKETTEKKMVEETIEKTEFLFTVGNDIQERKTTEQKNESFESRKDSQLELQQHGNGDMENLVFAVELGNKKQGQELQQNPKAASMAVARFEQADRSKEQEGGERFSTESSSESLVIQAEMRKSPSFHFELLAEGSTEDSDQTPLLYHDKTVTPLAQYQGMPVEEEPLKLEKSDSDKSRTPFLSFLKEEEEAHLVASQKNQDTVIAEKESAKEVWNSTSPKRRTKRRSKSSLFSNCLCCAAAIS